MAQHKNLTNSFQLIIPDFIGMFLALQITLWLKYGRVISTDLTHLHYQVFSIIFIFWLVIMFSHNLFDIRSLRSFSNLLISLASAMFFNILAAMIYFYIQPNLLLTPRRTLLLVAGFSFFFILIWHLVLKLIFKRTIVENYYLISAQNELAQMEEEFTKHGYLGVRLVKHLSSFSESSEVESANMNLIVSSKVLADTELLKKIYRLRLMGAEFFSPIEFYEKLLNRVPLEFVEEIWLVSNIGFNQSRFSVLSRRIIDLLAGIFFGVLFFLSFPVIVLAIKLSSPGPVFFTQARIGKNGRSFNLYKYRNMFAEGSGKGWTKVNDPRITSVGKILRKTHLDELPQFLNLLKGDMSIVGPRPEQLEIVEHLRQVIPFYDERHLIKPGLTGWAQLNIYAATVEETRRKLEYDLYYLKHRSILFDLEIILKTLYFVFRNKS